MDDERNEATAYQAGLCPHCGSRELNFCTEEADFAPASARKRVVCCDCGRKHQIQYHPISLRAYSGANGAANSRNVVLSRNDWVLWLRAVVSALYLHMASSRRTCAASDTSRKRASADRRSPFSSIKLSGLEWVMSSQETKRGGPSSGKCSLSTGM